MGLLERLLTPRGQAMPPGTHLAGEPTLFRAGEGSPATLKMPVFTPEDELIGRYVVVADASASFIVDGESVSLDETFERIGEMYGYITVVVYEPGKLECMEFGTRGHV